MGVFDLEDRHLSFDHSRVGAGALGGEQFVQDFGGDAAGGVSERVRGKNRLFAVSRGVGAGWV